MNRIAKIRRHFKEIVVKQNLQILFITNYYSSITERETKQRFRPIRALNSYYKENISPHWKELISRKQSWLSKVLKFNLDFFVQIDHIKAKQTRIF